MKHALFVSLTKVKDIYFLKDARWFHAFLVYLIASVLLVFPISLNLINSKTTNYELIGAELATKEIDGLLDELPNFSIAQGKLYYAPELEDQVITTNLNDSFIIILNTTSNKTEVKNTKINTIVFNESSFEVYLAGVSFNYDYQRFSNIHVSDLKNMDSDDAMTMVYNNIYVSLKSTFLLPLILVLIVVFFVTNLIFMLIIAMFARLLRIRDHNVPIYSEILKISFFASLLPSIISMLIGLLAPPITIVLFNFGLPLMLLIIYHKSKQIQINDIYKTQKDVEYLQ